MRTIPHFEQINDYYCGPTIMQMVLGAYDTAITQDEAALRLGTTEEVGTSPAALIKNFKEVGFTVTGGDHQTVSNLQQALEEEKIAVVCYTEVHLQWDHYAIVQGFDSDKVFLLDPAEQQIPYALELSEFEQRWVGPLFTFTDHWAIYISKTIEA